MMSPAGCSGHGKRWNPPGPGDMRRVSLCLAISHGFVTRGRRRFPCVDAVSAVGPVQEVLNHCGQVRYGFLLLAPLKNEQMSVYLCDYACPLRTASCEY